MTPQTQMGPSAQHRAAMIAGDIPLVRCTSCRQVHFYPSLACRSCGAPSFEHFTASGDANVYAVTAFGDGRNVAILQLAEGPRVLATLAEADAAIGAPVSARIDLSGADPRLIFGKTP